METHTGSQFARHLENISQVTVEGCWKCCRIDSTRLESNYSSQFMSTRHTGSWFARHLENIPRDEPQHRQAREINITNSLFHRQKRRRHPAYSTSHRQIPLYLRRHTSQQPMWDQISLKSSFLQNEGLWKYEKTNTIFVKASHIAVRSHVSKVVVFKKKTT